MNLSFGQNIININENNPKTEDHPTFDVKNNDKNKTKAQKAITDERKVKTKKINKQIDTQKTKDNAKHNKLLKKDTLEIAGKNNKKTEINNNEVKKVLKSIGLSFLVTSSIPVVIGSVLAGIKHKNLSALSKTFNSSSDNAKNEVAAFLKIEGNDLFGKIVQFFNPNIKENVTKAQDFTYEYLEKISKQQQDSEQKIIKLNSQKQKLSENINTFKKKEILNKDFNELSNNLTKIKERNKALDNEIEISNNSIETLRKTSLNDESGKTLEDAKKLRDSVDNKRLELKDREEELLNQKTSLEENKMCNLNEIDVEVLDKENLNKINDLETGLNKFGSINTQNGGTSRKGILKQRVEGIKQADSDVKIKEEELKQIQKTKEDLNKELDKIKEEKEFYDSLIESFGTNIKYKIEGAKSFNDLQKINNAINPSTQNNNNIAWSNLNFDSEEDYIITYVSKWNNLINEAKNKSNISIDNLEIDVNKSEDLATLSKNINNSINAIKDEITNNTQQLTSKDFIIKWSLFLSKLIDEQHQVNDGLIESFIDNCKKLIKNTEIDDSAKEQIEKIDNKTTTIREFCKSLTEALSFNKTPIIYFENLVPDTILLRAFKEQVKNIKTDTLPKNFQNIVNSFIKKVVNPKESDIKTIKEDLEKVITKYQDFINKNYKNEYKALKISLDSIIKDLEQIIKHKTQYELLFTDEKGENQACHLMKKLIDEHKDTIVNILDKAGKCSKKVMHKNQNFTYGFNSDCLKSIKCEEQNLTFENVKQYAEQIQQALIDYLKSLVDTTGKKNSYKTKEIKGITYGCIKNSEGKVEYIGVDNREDKTSIPKGWDLSFPCLSSEVGGESFYTIVKLRDGNYKFFGYPIGNIE